MEASRSLFSFGELNLLFTSRLFIDSGRVKITSAFCQYRVPMIKQILRHALGVSLLLALAVPLRAADSNTNDDAKAESKIFEEPPPWSSKEDFIAFLKDATRQPTARTAPREVQRRQNDPGIGSAVSKGSSAPASISNRTFSPVR
jgi:hypothetical protein